MKNLIIAFGILIVGALPAQAQYQELVDAKINQLVQIQQKVVQSNLDKPVKVAALRALTSNLMQLTDHRDEVSLEKLQTLEVTINNINKDLASKIYAQKKLKLKNMLNDLARMIQTKKSKGEDVTEFESMWRAMYAEFIKL